MLAAMTAAPFRGFLVYGVLVRVTVYVGCLSGVINDDDDDDSLVLASSYCRALLDTA